MKTLYISSFANPKPRNSNCTSTTLVSKLIGLNINASILTCSADPTWKERLTGELNNVSDVHFMRTNKYGMPIVSLDLPKAWYQHTLTEHDWGNAVRWGMKFLSHFEPDIVHLQQWQYLWWMLESAQRLGIPTVYSTNDYGMTCQRVFLDKGSGQPCDGEVSIEKCCSCVLEGRSLLGKVNEIILSLPGGSALVDLVCSRDNEGIISSRCMKLPIKHRVALRMRRSYSILSNLSACVVTSPFGAEVMVKNGVPKSIINILPWFHTVPHSPDHIKVQPRSLTIGFIGRLSPEKGLHLLLDAMSRLPDQNPPHLLIAGDVRGAYALDLYRRFQKHAGYATVEWLGWLNAGEVRDFYSKIHLLVVPSLCMETGPLSMIDGLAYKRPILCTDLPPLRWLIDTYGGGFVFPYGNVEMLGEILRKFVSGAISVTEISRNISYPPNLEIYSNRILDVYRTIISKSDLYVSAIGCMQDLAKEQTRPASTQPTA